MTFNGFRLVLIGSLGWTILCGAQQPARQQGVRAGQAADEPRSGSASQRPYEPFPDRNADRCYDAKDHDTADLCAQWRAAIAAEKAAKEARRATNWSIAGIILSFATIAGLIITIVQSAGALKEARRGNRIAQRANARATSQSVAALEHAQRVARADLRPWIIYNDFIVATFRDTPLGDQIVRDGRAAWLKLANTGRSPANRLRAFTDHRVTDFDSEVPVFERTVGENQGVLGTGFSVDGSKRYLDDREREALLDRRACIWLYAYVTYEDPASGENPRYETEVTLRITFEGMQHPHGGTPFERFIAMPTGPQNNLS